MKKYVAYLLAADSDMAPINSWCRKNSGFWKEGNVLVCNSTDSLRKKFEVTTGVSSPFIVSDTPLPENTWTNVLTIVVEGRTY